jgi:hypothetical protein
MDQHAIAGHMPVNFIDKMQKYLSASALVVPKNSLKPHIDIITLDRMNITATTAQ